MPKPYDSQRQDNITVFDIRAEKSVTLRGSMRVRLFLDVFNVTNAVAAETITVATGSSYLARPRCWLLASRGWASGSSGS